MMGHAWIPIVLALFLACVLIACSVAYDLSMRRELKRERARDAELEEERSRFLELANARVQDAEFEDERSRFLELESERERRRKQRQKRAQLEAEAASRRQYNSSFMTGPGA